MDILTRPETSQELERLVQDEAALAGVGRLTPERAELTHPVVAQADADDEPPLREPVKRGRLACYYPGASTGKRRDQHPEAHPHRRLSDRGNCDPWVGYRHAGEGHDVVPQEEPVPAGLLG